MAKAASVTIFNKVMTKHGPKKSVSLLSANLRWATKNVLGHFAVSVYFDCRCKPTEGNNDCTVKGISHFNLFVFIYIAFDHGDPQMRPRLFIFQYQFGRLPSQNVADSVPVEMARSIVAAVHESLRYLAEQENEF